MTHRRDGLLNDRVAHAFISACHAELRALKPGNVGLHGEMPTLSLAQFRQSALAAAPELVRSDSTAGAGVGARILRAIQATRGVVDTNTNLGIVLLAAPLMSAGLGMKIAGDPGPELRAALTEVLRALTVEDARCCYQAIRLAQPGGLGRSPAHDVADEPRITLLAAMQQAAAYDTVARQYADNYALVFELAWPYFGHRRRQGFSVEQATSATFIRLLAHEPDTLIVRKHGPGAGAQVMEQAQRWHVRLAALAADSAPDAALEQGLLDWDQALKAAGRNPGTTADIIVATLLVEELVRAVNDL